MTLDHTRAAAYEAGRAARRERKLPDANPYPYTTDTRLWLAEAWLEGWRDADRMLRDLGV